MQRCEDKTEITEKRPRAAEIPSCPTHLMCWFVRESLAGLLEGGFPRGIDWNLNLSVNR